MKINLQLLHHFLIFGYFQFNLSDPKESSSLTENIVRNSVHIFDSIGGIS